MDHKGIVLATVFPPPALEVAADHSNLHLDCSVGGTPDEIGIEAWPLLVHQAFDPPLLPLLGSGHHKAADGPQGQGDSFVPVDHIGGSIAEEAGGAGFGGPVRRKSSSPSWASPYTG